MHTENVMYWDRFDICEAWYQYSVDWHGGQWTDDYAITGRLHNMGFRPSMGQCLESLTDNGFAIYNQLYDSYV